MPTLRTASASSPGMAGKRKAVSGSGRPVATVPVGPRLPFPPPVPAPHYSTIDRFDGRALLDFYKEPDPSVFNRPKAPNEERLELVRRRGTRAPPRVLSSCVCAAKYVPS